MLKKVLIENKKQINTESFARKISQELLINVEKMI